MLTLVGPEAEVVLREVAGDSLTVLGQPYGTHQLVGFKGAPLVVAMGCGLHFPGYTLIVDEAQAGELFGLLASKGCYIGQETLSKLTNLNGVKQQLVSLTLSGPVEPGCDIESDEGVRLGRVTSVATTPDGQHVALGFMKCKSKGQQVELAGSASGLLTDLTAL
ncbi:aminomethyltransferase [Haematococcus lacustris]|uniref:Aminomethyltransferase n=1 Tax=Haematococcus lacustris TaxID=44745 RepID=A0A699ZYG6_HAELA|nr:aminomethyltransferase [Haematococcus lacustris]